MNIAENTSPQLPRKNPSLRELLLLLLLIASLVIAPTVAAVLSPRSALLYLKAWGLEYQFQKGDSKKTFPQLPQNPSLRGLLILSLLLASLIITPTVAAVLSPKSALFYLKAWGVEYHFEKGDMIQRSHR